MNLKLDVKTYMREDVPFEIRMSGVASVAVFAFIGSLVGVSSTRKMRKILISFAIILRNFSNITFDAPAYVPS